MSATKKRCIIKKLDFENCIITNIKTKARGRKRLRARITKEFEDYDNQDETQKSSESSQRISSPEPSSPVSTRKQSDGDGSPVLFSKRKTLFDNSQQLSDSTVDEIQSPPKSPVFRITTKLSSSKKQKTQSSRMSSSGVSTESSRDSDKPHCSYQIEELSQLSSQNIHISSFDSQNTTEKSSENYSVKIRESSPEVSKSFIEFNPRESVPETVPEAPSAVEVCEEVSEFSKKRYKKNSLLGNLQKVLRKQESVKLLWQHQKRKNKTMNFIKLVVNNFWTVDSNYVLKCDIIMEAQTIYAFVDSCWVPNIKKVKKGSVLHLHPPWQQIVLKETNTAVLLSIVCLEVLDENVDFPAKETNIQTVETIPVEDFKTDETLFVRSLFSSQRTGFIC